MLLSDVLPTVARAHPKRKAILTGEWSITFEDLHRRVVHVAEALYDEGLRPGDRVALLGWPCPALVEAELAAVAMGAIPFSVFAESAPPETALTVLDGDPAAIVYAPEAAGLAADVSSPSLRLRIPTIDGTEVRVDRAAGRGSSVSPELTTRPEDVAIIIYTGGTTGRPKGVMHTHRGVLAWALLTPAGGPGAGPAVSTILPNLAHVLGQHAVWSAMAGGQTLVIPGPAPLGAEDLVALALRHRPPFLGLTGGMLRSVVEHLESAGLTLDFVRTVAHGAAPASPATLRRALASFPGALVGEIYAQTESGIAVTGAFVNDLVRDAAHPERLTAVGTARGMALVGQRPYEVRVVDGEDQDASGGAPGEVVCRGDGMMLGYWNRPEETAAALRGGWLHTGDIGYLDDDGHLFLVDREKDMVKSGALPVYCIEVEKIVEDHPAVAECSVIGTPTPNFGEAVTVVVVPYPGHTITLADIRLHCDGRIAAYKIPTRLETTDRLPRTAVYKVDKRALREPFWAGHGRRIG